MTGEARAGSAPEIPDLAPDIPDLMQAAHLSRWLADHGLPALRRMSYRRWKPGTSAVAAVELADGPAFVAIWTQRAPDKIDKYLLRPAGRVLLADRDRGVLVATPAADRHLPGLATPDLIASPLSYKPMRRWVGRCDGSGDVQVVRLYRPGDAVAAARRHRAVRKAVPETAAVIRASEDRLVLHHLPGRPGRSDRSGDLAALGRVLARWHAIDAPATAPPARRPSWRASAALAARLAPEFADRIRSLVASAALGVGQIPRGPARLCHGDVSPDQAVMGMDGEATLIDLDHAGAGWPAWDLATLRSGLASAEQCGAVLAGYGLDEWPAAVHAVLPMVCLGRATEGFRTCRPDWRPELDRLLTLAEDTVARSGR